jgi:hypothetical protein
MALESEASRLDLTVWVTEGLKQAQIRWTYSKDLFEEGDIIRMHRHFEALLFNIIDRPDARLTALKVMSSGDTGLNGDREEPDFRRLRSIRRKTVIVSNELA